jgi:uncharacterized sulfatase
MKSDPSHKPLLLKKFKTAARSFASLALIWLILILVFSFIEILFNSFSHGLPTGFFTLIFWSWYLDLQFWFKWVLLGFIIYTPVYMLSPKIARLSFQGFILLFLIVQLLLLSYFNTAMVMLGADLFGYSLQEIVQTVGASGGIPLVSVIFFISLILMVILVLRYVPKKLNFHLYLALLIPLLSFLFLVFGVSKMPGSVNLKSDFANSLVTNKSDYFYTASYSHYFPEVYETDIYSDNYIAASFNRYSKAIPLKYVDETQYPFLHEAGAGDVLSPFFKPEENAPNIVIILVEGLGRAFTNKGAYLGNFTPFLDSLSDKSLYWKNFVSTGGRTFAVLPSLLGSLPFLENGFLGLGNKMPDQLSLMNVLQFNGYRTSFYYGGDASFDNMGLYLEKNNIDELNDINTFPTGYKKLPSNNGFTWGYNDNELFRYYLNTRPAKKGHQPQLSVILTVAMHSPFLIDEADKYSEVFENRMDYLGFNEKKKNTYRYYKKQYSSIMYTDDALKTFFEAYKKREDYNNTIFLITGDHRIPEIPMSTKIDRYHVPLIIFSPMLERTAEIASVSTHFDIPSSLLAFLKTNFEIQTPMQNSWLGQGLDTTRGFQNLHQVPLMQTKTNMIDFIMGEYHLNGDKLYKLNEDLGEELVNDNEKKNQLIKAFNQFRKKNNVIINGGKIVPDSLFRNYTIQN